MDHYFTVPMPEDIAALERRHLHNLEWHLGGRVAPTVPVGLLPSRGESPRSHLTSIMSGRCRDATIIRVC